MSTRTKSEEKVFNALDKAESIQFSRAAAYVILKDGKYEGKVNVAYPKDGAGLLRVFLWDWEHGVQMGTAGGYGYDKLSAAMEGLKFKDIEFTDHPQNWERQLRALDYEVIQAL